MGEAGWLARFTGQRMSVPAIWEGVTDHQCKHYTIPISSGSAFAASCSTTVQYIESIVPSNGETQVASWFRQVQVGAMHMGLGISTMSEPHIDSEGAPQRIYGVGRLLSDIATLSANLRLRIRLAIAWLTMHQHSLRRSVRDSCRKAHPSPTAALTSVTVPLKPTARTLSEMLCDMA